MPLPEPHRDVVAKLVARLPIDAVAWALTGSAGLAVHGLDVVVNDIDVQTDARDWARVQQSFAEYVTVPVTYSSSATIRSHFGRLSVGGITVEIVGATQQRLPEGTWTTPADPRVGRVLIDYGDLTVPVLDLAREERSYRLMGRTEKADLIRRAIIDGQTTERDRKRPRQHG